MRDCIGSVRLDVGLANDTSEVVILFAKKSDKFRAAHPNRIEPLGDKLRPDLWRLHCRSEPVGELRDCVLRRLRRGEQPQPIVHLVVIVAGLSNGPPCQCEVRHLSRAI
jgi:hypothetical protein